jgi:Fe-S cluster assembly protein SufD
MTAVAERNDKDLFLRHFDQLDRIGAAPQFQALRQTARGRFRHLAFPGRRTEDWRFTSVAPLLNVPFEPATFVDMAADALPAPPTPDTLRLVFVNGVFDAKWSRVADVPAGVEVGSLAVAKAAPQLGTIAEYTDHIFTALNTALVRDGAYVNVPDGVVLERPIEIIYLAAPGHQPVAAHPRTLIVAGKNARAQVVERFSATGEGVYFTNAVAEVVLGEGAVVDHYKVQQEDAQAFHVASTQVVLAGRANFSTHYVALGGRLVRNEVRVRFGGEHAEATVNGLYLGAGTQHVDNFTVIDHAKPNCASHELYKGILADHAHGVFNGKIFVRPDAQKTDAKQTNKVLLLSDDATINTKPQLEIFADDVKCTHGATVGQLDETQLFYLRSRGIGADAARSLLTFAFANDVVGRIKLEAIRDELEQVIVNRKFV